MVKRLEAEAVPWISSLVRGEVVPTPTFPPAVMVKALLERETEPIVSRSPEISRSLLEDI